jgi:hypothetical protein
MPTPTPQPDKFVALIYYVGQHPLRAGRVALAVILFMSDFGTITGWRYLKARTPGELAPPRSLLDAVRKGWRWGAVEHRLLTGTLRRRDAEWIAAQWREGVPV